jgi:hypothetical protein
MTLTALCSIPPRALALICMQPMNDPFLWLQPESSCKHGYEAVCQRPHTWPAGDGSRH